MLIVSLVAARIAEASRENQKPGKQERIHEDIDRGRDDKAKGDGEIGKGAGSARQDVEIEIEGARIGEDAKRDLADRRNQRHLIGRRDIWIIQNALLEIAVREIKANRNADI